MQKLKPLKRFDERSLVLLNNNFLNFNLDKPKINMKEILDQLSDNSDTESSDDSYYFHSLTNPLKTVSIKDLKINKIKNTFLNC